MQKTDQDKATEIFITLSQKQLKSWSQWSKSTLKIHGQPTMVHESDPGEVSLSQLT